MKWEDDVIKTKDESEPKSNNKCSLVWEVKNNCKPIIINMMKTSSFYFRVCLNSAILGK